jgi:hypothetical protein
MPDHRFMYPKVVPVVHNFAGAKVRNPLHNSGGRVQAPKTASDFSKSDGGHYREASAR